MTTNVNYLYFLDYVKKNFDYKKIKVLDFGCGKGEIVELLLENDIDVVGLDVYEYNDDLKKEKSDIFEDKKIIPVKINTKFPFEDNTFDLIISNMVFEHVENIKFTASELNRVLKKDGAMYHHFPCKDTWREGHVLITFSHWFSKNSKVRYYYMYLMRLLGFGMTRPQYKTTKDFVKDSCRILDDLCCYRKKKEILKYFSNYTFASKEIEYIKFRGKENSLISFIIKLKIFNKTISWLFVKLAFSAIEMKRKNT